MGCAAFYAFYAELSPFLPVCTRRVGSLYVVTVLILADEGYSEGFSHFKSVRPTWLFRLFRPRSPRPHAWLRLRRPFSLLLHLPVDSRRREVARADLMDEHTVTYGGRPQLCAFAEEAAHARPSCC